MSWKDILKLLPPKDYVGIAYQETSDKTFKEVKVEGEVWGRFTGAINEDGTIFARPHYLWAVTNRSRSKLQSDIEFRYVKVGGGGSRCSYSN